jgi:hypothetical protein
MYTDYENSKALSEEFHKVFCYFLVAFNAPAFRKETASAIIEKMTKSTLFKHVLGR